MSVETLDREGGDDRQRDVVTQRLQEMLDQPDAPEIVYASDAAERKAGIGDIVLQPARSRYPRQLGGVALIRRAHMRPVSRTTLGAEQYLG